MCVWICVCCEWNVILYGKGLIKSLFCLLYLSVCQQDSNHNILDTFFSPSFFVSLQNKSTYTITELPYHTNHIQLSVYFVFGLYFWISIYTTVFFSLSSNKLTSDTYFMSLLKKCFFSFLNKSKQRVLESTARVTTREKRVGLNTEMQLSSLKSIEMYLMVQTNTTNY